jgi:hypothetical protein
MLVLHHDGNKTLFLIPAHRIPGTLSVSINHPVPVFGGLASSRRNGPSDRTPCIDTWLNVQYRDVSLMLKAGPALYINYRHTQRVVCVATSLSIQRKYTLYILQTHKKPRRS